jgi:hypothetical protein
MSGPFGSSQWMYSSGGFYPTTIEQSLRFNDDDSAYLSWTPASAGNRKTWTWSGWVKRGNINTDQLLLHCYDGSSSNRGVIKFSSGNILEFDTGGSGSVGRIDSSAVFRDTSAWYHIVAVMDTSNATSTDRQRLYVNGERISVTVDAQVAQNFDGLINTTNSHQLGSQSGSSLLDGYLAEVNFIDGQALDPTDFGEFKSGVWVAKEYTGSYGTNGFYLPFKQTTVANGFNTVTWSGNGGTQSIEGVGFSPDLVWSKTRTRADWHYLQDSVRGANNVLFSNTTDAEIADTNALLSFDADGFTSGNDGAMNDSGQNYVAWCWDAGSGSPVSNTDGSITSSVKSNPAYGFSVVSWTGNASGGSTVGHGLSSAPDMIIVKNRSDVENWAVYHSSVGNTGALTLNATDATLTSSAYWNNTSPTSSVFTLGGDNSTNGSGNSMIAYCFAEISGYSSFGSYSGSGSAGNTITTGFKPAFVMIKRTDTTSDWQILDATRDTADARNRALFPSDSRAEISNPDNGADFTDTGFDLNGNGANVNASGGTYIYMAFADTRDAAFWRDLSGNDNTWQPNALQNSDVLIDSPTQNWCVLNPLWDTSYIVYSEGNLKLTQSTTNADAAVASIGMSSGKWYWEVLNVGGNTSPGIGNSSMGHYNYVGSDANGWSYFINGDKYNNAVATSYGASYTAGDIIGVAYDADTGDLTFYKNGVSQGVAFSGLSGEMFPAFSTSNGVNVTNVANFGQDSSFAGNKTPQGNTDDNGVGDFYYAPPSGFLALNAQNLPTTAIDPAKDDVPADYFNTVLWTGDGTSPRNITGFGFTPDLLWSKTRNQAHDHRLTDAVRGAADGYLSSNNTNTSSTSFGRVLSFITDGVQINDLDGINASGDTTVGWGWLAGNGTSSNTDGSITSTVSASEKAGFSVVGWSGDGTTATIGHGLGAAPSWVLVRRYDRSGDAWRSYHEPLGPTKFLEIFNTDAAQTSAVGAWNDTAPTSSVFTIGSGLNNGGDIIAYCFAEVEGYSKFGSYTGNGSTDGPFVYCGFRPAFVLFKNADGAGNSWLIFDDARTPYNQEFLELKPDSSAAESPAGSYAYFDFLSNGFKPRTTSTATNASGQKIIFAAFAQNPFKYANAR